MGNIPTVQDIYAAFGRGDVPAILAHLAEDIVWEYAIADTGVPWLQSQAGRAGVVTFFESLAAVDFQKFQPKTFLENESIVVALIDATLVVKATGRTISEEDEVHIWHFNARGQVIRFGHKVDTHQHWLAFHGK